jgi:stearoyl-CoA desaturase (delta-9 desaturase)
VLGKIGTHIWGYRNYATPDDSRNNPVIGFIAGGEGWHNNHRADPASARHGHHWWEVGRLHMVDDPYPHRLVLATNVSLRSPNIDAKHAPRLDFPTGIGP